MPRRPAKGPWPWLLVGLGVAACQPLWAQEPPVPATGGLLVNVARGRGRTVQYVASQVAAIRLSLVDAANGSTVTYDDLSPTLRTTKNNKNTTYSFAIQNLPAATYSLTLTAFADTAQTQAIGSTTSAPFSVVAGSTVSLSVPNLDLAPTPVGGWIVTAQVLALPSGATVRSYSYTLDGIDGTVTTKSVKTSQSRQTHTWSNVLAYPAGVSTVSVTVTAGSRHRQATATAFATASIGGATTSSTLSFFL